MNHELRITYGTSRGRETYGYGVVTLYERGQKVARCNGGGYDMRGTVFGDWLESVYQDRLVALAKRKKGAFPLYTWNGKDGKESNFTRTDADRKVELYGGTFYNKGQGKTEYTKPRPAHVRLDGGCGFESIRRIAVALGLEIRTLDGGKKLDIILVTDTKAKAEG